MLANKEINLYRGDDRTLEITVADTQGQAIDLTGAEIKFSVKRNVHDHCVQIQKATGNDSEVVITNAQSGIFQVYLVPDDSNELNPGPYQYDVELKTSEGKTYTVLRSVLTILDDITRP